MHGTIASCEERVASIADEVRALKAQSNQSKDKIASAVTMLLSAKAVLADTYEDRIEMLRSMVRASGRVESDIVTKEIYSLEAKRKALLPRNKEMAKAEKKSARQATQEAAQIQMQLARPIGEPNPLQWPETSALPLELCERINHYLALGDVASEAELARALQSLDEMLQKSSVSATIKLDGTNVGYECHDDPCTPCLVGRRLRIDGDEYCKTSLSSLYQSVDTPRLKKVLQQAMPASVIRALLRLTIYGELCCNDLYDYRALGLLSSWRAYGIVIQLMSSSCAAAGTEADGTGPSPSPAYLMALQLASDGWAATASGADAIRISACPKLWAVFREAGVPMVDSVDMGAPGGLLGLISKWAPTMIEQCNEGLVVTIQPPCAESMTKSGDRQLAMVHKWKISAEHQPRCISELHRLRARLASLSESGRAAVLLPGSLHEAIVQAVDTMLAVATAPLSSQFKRTTGLALPRKYLKGDVLGCTRPASKLDEHERQASEATDANGSDRASEQQSAERAIDEMLRSALTKFDALSSVFAGGGTPASVSSMLLDEMAADLVGMNASRKMARSRVNRHVAKQHGAWQRQTKESGLEATGGGGL